VSPGDGLGGNVHGVVSVEVACADTVDGRSVGHADEFDGVFVAMSVTAFDPVIDFQTGFDPNMIQLEPIDGSD